MATEEGQQSRSASDEAVFWAGVRDSIPFLPLLAIICLGFGAFSESKGLSLSSTIGLSAILYSTPLQVLIVQNLEDPLKLILPIILTMNARFALMAAVLSRYFRDVPLGKIAATITLLVPTAFANCFTRFKTAPRHALTYFIGIGLPLYITSNVSTWLGYILGANWVNETSLAFGAYALALFLTLLAAKLWPHVYEMAAYCAGFLVAPVFHDWFGNYNLLFTPFFIGLVLVYVRKLDKKRA